MTKRIKLMANMLLMAAFAAMLCTSCSKDDPAPVQATGVTLNKTTLTLTVGETETLTATVTPDNAADKTVTWTSSATAVATVDAATGKVTAVALGEAAITATTANGKTATCALTVTPVEVGDVTLNKTTLTLTVGETETLTATVTPDNAADKTVTWTSIAPTVATVTDGLVTAVAKGAATITATTANGKTAICEVTVEYIVETVLIPNGTFLMGSPETEPNRFTNRETQHEVTLTKDYWMSKYPITNAQYATFLNDVGVDGTGAKVDIQNGERLIESSSAYISYDWGLHYNGNQWEPAANYENNPVIFVSWYGAKAYAEWASGDLPTEAQWERAARGGVESMPFGLGNGKVLTSEMANFEGTHPYDLDKGGTYNDNSGVYVHRTTAVDAYPDHANAYGLYDMHGNVIEWCLDQWDGSSDYAGSPATDPVGETGLRRVLRGGYYLALAQTCRSAYRGSHAPADRDYYGFRIVFVVN
ncbi:MAG: SUMF1/EgtB/PvdO family nonheme iron enzyme [Prevotellaceae bacterium]|jgi:formylglycine-generating enzyme required for sulfatase activity|nr:SUMF1/EgtB/PvdO family nonheme iron enzyme [Prevotellaceae bacterium]